MPASYKVLGQSNPSSATNTNIYTVPASTSAIVSTLTICNLSSSATTVRVAVRPAGATVSGQHWIVYDASLPGSDSMCLTLGLCLASTDVVTIYAASANVGFSLFGTEIT